MVSSFLFMKKIDIHCHTTKRLLEGLVDGDASIDAILSHMQEFEIEKTVLLATYFPHKGSGISNFRLLDWIQYRPKFLMFASLDINNYLHQGLSEIEELADSKVIAGIKIYTCYQTTGPKCSALEEVVLLAETYHLPIAFHCGYSFHAQKDYGRPAIGNMVKASDIGLIARRHPNIPFIICHMSKPYTEDLIWTVKQYQNVVADMSGLIDSKHDRILMPSCIEDIKQYLGEVGPDRLLFGTDFPVQTHADSVYFIEEAMKSYSDDDKQLVYYGNAKRLLGLPDMHYVEDDEDDCQ